MFDIKNFLNFVKFMFSSQEKDETVIFCILFFSLLFFAFFSLCIYIKEKKEDDLAYNFLHISSICFFFSGFFFLGYFNIVKNDISEINNLKSLVKEIENRDYINSYEKEKYEKQLKRKIKLSVEYFYKNDKDFFEYIAKNYNFVKLLKEENLTKDENEYKERTLILMEKIDKRVKKLIF